MFFEPRLLSQVVVEVLVVTILSSYQPKQHQEVTARLCSLAQLIGEHSTNNISLMWSR